MAMTNEIPTDWKRGNISHISKKEKKARSGELQASQSHVSAHHAEDRPGIYGKAHGR